MKFSQEQALDLHGHLCLDSVVGVDGDGDCVSGLTRGGAVVQHHGVAVYPWNTSKHEEMAKIAEFYQAMADAFSEEKD